MKRPLTKVLIVLLCVFLLCPLTSRALGATEAGFEIPFTKEALLSALYEADISTLRQAISLELVSCEELTAYYLDRVENYNEPYNCFITICDDALEVARQRDAQLAAGNAQGLLFGIPIVIKDNMDLAGYLTTSGHSKSESPTADSDAYVVSRLLEEGAVIIAKANMSTDAQDARISYSQAVGQTKNAYNTLLAAGGSSGGSAVATSLNFAAASLGTDTNSSLRIPAALNGCVSLRATTGLISMAGIDKLNSTRDVPGAITRSVYDLAIMMDVLTDSAYNYTENLNGDALDGLRIGILSELVQEGHDDADQEVLAAFQSAVEELRQCGAEVITVSMPNLFALSDPTFNSNKQSYKDALYEGFQDLLAEYGLDAVIYPTYSSTPLRSGKDENGVSWSAWGQPFLNNCRTLSPSAGIPEVSVVIGYHSLGAGIGMEIAAPRNCEQLLLDIAYTYTSHYDHRQVPEGAPDAYVQSRAGSLSELIEAYLAAADAATAPTTIPTEAPTVPTTQATEAPTYSAETEVPQESTPIHSGSGDSGSEEETFSVWLLPLGLALLAAMVLVLIQIHVNRIVRRKRRSRKRNSNRDSSHV